MRHRWPLTRWLALILVLAASVYFGSRWLLEKYYPLEYRASLFQHAQEQGLDPYLVAAVIRTESRWRPNVVSKSGARGLMQIMPDTGEWIASQMHVPFKPDQLYDPDYNIRLGCWYLAELRREFGGDTVVALAAYNGGRNNVRQWLTDREWTGEPHTIDQIPFKETRSYVAKVLTDFERYHRIYGGAAPQAEGEMWNAGTESAGR